MNQVLKETLIYTLLATIFLAGILVIFLSLTGKEFTPYMLVLYSALMGIGNGMGFFVSDWFRKHREKIGL